MGPGAPARVPHLADPVPPADRRPDADSRPREVSINGCHPVPVVDPDHLSQVMPIANLCNDPVRRGMNGLTRSRGNVDPLMKFRLTAEWG